MDRASQTPTSAIQQRRQLLHDGPTTGFECTFGVDVARERIVAAGGKILMDKSTIPSVGYLLAFQDPGSNLALAMEYNPSTE